VAAALSRRRDLGLGLVAPREGRAHAAPSLRGVAGLTYRLHRGTIAGWGVGFILTAIVFGSLAPSVANAFGDNTQLRDIIERMGGSADSLSVQFVASLCPLFGIAAALYGVQAMLRLHTEEAQGRLEPLLATPAPRLRWYAGHLVAALAGTTALMVAAGVALASTAVIGLPAHTVGFGDVLAGALAQLPAVWVLVGVAAALVGALPRHTVLAWVLTGIVLAIGWIGPAINLSESVMRLSPFEHVPKLPGGAVHAGPLMVLLLIAAALIAVGAAGMRQRDFD
jgi:ABC-2 type transport system permease protein